MPSLLSCFCVHHRRHTLSSRKRNSRKKILNRSSDWISDTSSDLYNRRLSDEGSQYQNAAPRVVDSEDSEILSRLLDRQSSPRRRHVGDIFREEPPVIEPLPLLHSLYGAPGAQSMERMNGYVPKAMGHITASSALTGGKIDDFFSDCRLNTALGKFASSTEFNEDNTSDFYTIDRTEKRTSIVKVGSTGDKLYNLPSSNLNMDLDEEDSLNTDDVTRGSVSSASPSYEASEDYVISREPVENGFFFPETSDIALRHNNFDPTLANMFHSDGDILY